MAMVIAEALAQRKDLLKEASTLQGRIAAAAVSFEDEAPSKGRKGKAQVAEDAQALLARLDEVYAQAEALSIAINRTNNEVAFNFDNESLSLMEAIARRERLINEQSAYSSIARAVENSVRVYARTKDDIRQVATIDVVATRKRGDKLAETVRRLDIEIQKLNWTAPLID